jgi:ubiquinone/menaquinone biosynthesis C-methylase UbiE
MGFFSIPAAQLVGSEGRVICVDVQQKMLDVLLHRARRADMEERIEVRLCEEGSLGIADLSSQIDFALAFAVVHEVPDASRLFDEIHAALKPGSRVLVAEPRGHVKKSAFAETVAVAEACGLGVVDSPEIWRCHTAVLEKKRNAEQAALGG